MYRIAAAAQRQSGNRLPIDPSLNSLASAPYNQESDSQQPPRLLVETHILFDKAHDSRTMAVCQMS